MLVNVNFGDVGFVGLVKWEIFNFGVGLFFPWVWSWFVRLALICKCNPFNYYFVFSTIVSCWTCNYLICWSWSLRSLISLCLHYKSSVLFLSSALNIWIYLWSSFLPCWRSLSWVGSNLVLTIGWLRCTIYRFGWILHNHIGLWWGVFWSTPFFIRKSYSCSFLLHN